MILLIGYSTIPFAPAAFSRGTIMRTYDSSTIVFTSTQSGSESEVKVAASVVADGVEVMSDIHASAAYRANLARVETARAILAALTKAR